MIEIRRPGLSRLLLLLGIALIFQPTLLRAQVPLPASVRVPGARSADGVWSPPDASRLGALASSRIARTPGAVATLDRQALQAILSRAPLEDTLPRGAGAVELTLPLPDGRFGRFTVEESPMLAPELAALFPQIKTYRGAGLDDPTAVARFGWTDLGFHAIVLAAGGSLYIDPYAPGDLVNYVSVNRSDMPGRGDWTCELGSGPLTLARMDGLLPISSGTQKRTYRLALAATGEYTTAAGGTKGAALSRMTATMNRVNGIYMRDLAVMMTLSTGSVGDPTALIYTDGGADPYTNDDGIAMLTQNKTTIDTLLGTGGYDIGHVFSTGGGGVASLNAVCSTNKARGVTGSGNPTGDAFDVDYVAHEMGHQFGGNHTFNGTTSACGGGNRSAAHAVEPGSGTTIMGYAGICGGEDTQRNSNDHFSIESLNEITTFLAGSGGSCAVTTATGNSLPSLSAGSNYSIPKQTPFLLTGSATDSNGDALTYTWEQWDAGGATSSAATMAVDDGTRTLFRSYAPASSATRMFPALPFVLGYANVPPQTYTGSSLVSGVVCSFGTCATGEAMPTTTRTLKFQLTARDNRAGGGGVVSAPVTITVDGNAGPFRVTNPNTAQSLTGLSALTVTWDVNSTSTYAANVNIYLSLDGGQTFPQTLLLNTPNDGSQGVTLPNVTSTTARVVVSAAGNVFFDVSDANFSITALPAPGAFGKSSPSNGATNQVPRPTLSWAAASGATGYEYCIDTVNDNACGGGFVSAGAGTSVVVSGLSPSTTYYWQVRAANGAGTTYADGAASSYRSFTTGAEFMTNGGFGSGTSGWSTYATPDSSYISYSTAGGVLAFHRLAPPPGTSNQATVFQNTGAALPSDAPISAQFDLGNTDSVRKRISVLILEADFSDLSVCTFWLPPNTPLTTYAMAMRTTKAWTNASIYFYAATAGSGGDYLVDNVSIQRPGGAATARTTCDDPFAPGAAGGADGPQMLTNGDFSSGALAPGWSSFGTVTAQVSGGVLQFIRPTSAVPVGVVLQPTSTALNANAVLTATFQLGNSSGVRKRVTVLLHDNDFTDLAACTFWLPAGEALSSYAVRSYATKAWSNATLSVYPATVGAEQWMLMDNVGLQQTPSAAPLGTECVEPGVTLPSPVMRTHQ